MDSEIELKIAMALLGGSLIAISSSLNYMLYGKTTGLSGYLFQVASLDFNAFFPLKLCFLVGLVTIVDLYSNTSGRYFWGQKVLDAEEDINIFLWILGGLLIGLGVRWSGGCTSGHGVCGLPRLSMRSLIAVGIFMSSGIATATLISVTGKMSPLIKMDESFKNYYSYVTRGILSIYQLFAVFYVIYFLFTKESAKEKLKPLAFLVLGSIFGSGLLVSGMCSRSKILSFLTISQNWDPSLAFVMASAVGINFLAFQYTMRKGRAVFEDEIDLPDTHIDKGILIGPGLFGVGWGITGFCPGPALANITSLGFALLLVIAIFSGQLIHDALENRLLRHEEDKNLIEYQALNS